MNCWLRYALFGIGMMAWIVVQASFPTNVCGQAAITAASQDQAVACQMGWAAVDITPRAGTAMAGYYSRRDATGVHDPLWSKAMVLSDGSQTAAIVSLDLISTTMPVVAEARKLIREQTGIPEDAIMISATHSHTGPMLSSGSKRTAVFGGLDDEAMTYMAQLAERIAESVKQAKAQLQPVILKAGTEEERQLAFNRRFFLRDGSVGWNPGKLNSKIVREAGPTDDRLHVLGIFSPKEEPLGVMANFSIHLDTVGGTEWSADVPYTVQDSLQKVFGTSFFVHYTTGCCGDVNHIDVRTAMAQKGHGEAARIGLRLASAALRSWPKLQTVPSGTLRFERNVVQLSSDAIAPERVEWAHQVVSALQQKKTPAPKFMELVEAFKVIDIDERKGEPWSCEVQVITLGNHIAWVSLPGEIFVQLGMMIKDGSPYPMTMVHELANGSLGYIPTSQAFAQGNYEVVSSRVAQGSGEKLVETALASLRRLYRPQ